jgi:hypothetical protein
MWLLERNDELPVRWCQMQYKAQRIGDVSKASAALEILPTSSGARPKFETLVR